MGNIHILSYYKSFKYLETLVVFLSQTFVKVVAFYKGETSIRDKGGVRDPLVIR